MKLLRLVVIYFIALFLFALYSPSDAYYSAQTINYTVSNLMLQAHHGVIVLAVELKGWLK